MENAKVGKILLVINLIVFNFLIAISIPNLPIYAIVAYFAWISGSFLFLLFMKEWSSGVFWSLALALVFAIIYSSTDWSYFLLYAFQTALSELALIFICLEIHSRRNETIISRINEKRSQIESLEKELNNKKSMVHLLSLMKRCDCDINSIENNKNINNINQVMESIDRMNHEIIVLESKFKRGIDI